MNQFLEDLKEAKKVANDAAREFIQLRREQKIHERLVRMKVSSFMRTLEQFNHAPSLAVSSERDTTKDGGAWFAKSTYEEQGL